MQADAIPQAFHSKNPKEDLVLTKSARLTNCLLFDDVRFRGCEAASLEVKS